MTRQQQADEALHKWQDAREAWKASRSDISAQDRLDAEITKTRNAWLDRNRREARRRRNFRALELIAGGLFMLTLAMGLIIGMAM